MLVKQGTLDRIMEVVHGYACGCTRAWPTNPKYDDMVTEIQRVLESDTPHRERYKAALERIRDRYPSTAGEVAREALGEEPQDDDRY